MKDSDLSDALEVAVADEFERLKKLPASLLRVLGHEGVTQILKVGAHSYEIKAWSKPVAEVPDSFVVLAGALERSSSGSTHLRGFLVKPGQPYTDLPESLLRSYDEP
jgi:hypothetical protein